MIKEKDKISVSKQCSILCIDRRNLYYKPVDKLAKYKIVMKKIYNLWEEEPSRGARQILHYLLKAGYNISRKVLAWKLSNTLDNSFCIDALNEAIRKYGKPKIFNTDQGSQYTAHNFIKVLEDNEIAISMDEKGRALDNIFIERLWRTVKYEHIFLWRFDSVSELKASLKLYFEKYNQKRLHKSLDYKTPDEVYYKKGVADAA